MEDRRVVGLPLFPDSKKEPGATVILNKNVVYSSENKEHFTLCKVLPNERTQF